MVLGVGDGDLTLSLAEAWPSAVWYLVDPFVSPYPLPHGPKEATDDDHQEIYEDLRRRLRGQEDRLLLVRDFSFSFAKALAADTSPADSRGELPALVFRDISGGHAAAITDLISWWPLVRPGGFLAGTGYFSNTDIRRAVDDFALQERIHLAEPSVWPAAPSGDTPCWVLQKHG